MSGPSPSAAPAAVQGLLPDATWALLLVLAGVAAAAWLAAAGLGALVTRLAARRALVGDLSRRARRPFRLAAVLVALLVVLDSATGVGDWRGPVVRVPRSGSTTSW